MLDREQPVTLEHSLVHPEGPVIAAEHLFRQDSSSSWTPTSLSVSSRPVEKRRQLSSVIVSSQKKSVWPFGSLTATDSN